MPNQKYNFYYSKQLDNHLRSRLYQEPYQRMYFQGKEYNCAVKCGKDWRETYKWIDLIYVGSGYFIDCTYKK